MSTQGTGGFDASYFNNQRDRGFVRSAIRTAYLLHTRLFARGPTLDFGCGSGGMLRLLPEGSRGLEINPSAVEYCRSRGLAVDLYEPAVDRYAFDIYTPGTFSSFVSLHVLEHIPEPETALTTILASCARIGITRAVFAVPGKKGYSADPTHQTFIDLEWFKGFSRSSHDFKLSSHRYFPVPFAGFGEIFPHNELIAIFER